MLFLGHVQLSSISIGVFTTPSVFLANFRLLQLQYKLSDIVSSENGHDIVSKSNFRFLFFYFPEKMPIVRATICSQTTAAKLNFSSRLTTNAIVVKKKM